jgi:ketosteroid isomerase-like protein
MNCVDVNSQTVKATRGEEAMSRANGPTMIDSVQVRALVNRQVQAWEKHDFAIAADDWLPNGKLFSPGGHVVKKDMQSAILNYFKNFTDLKVTVNEMFLSEDGTRLAIQWDWTVTRKKDRKRTTTHDAILVHLGGGKIASWNEYFG